MPIDATLSVNAVKRLSPETDAVLHRFGMSGCCGGTMALGTAVRHHDLEIDVVLNELNAAVPSRVIDVRPLPCDERRARVFAAVEALAPGETFLLINDHDPHPLYRRLCAELDGPWTWEYLEAGPLAYVIQVGRPSQA